jgi:hypothetical protein
VLDISTMPELTPAPSGFFARVGAALAILARYAGCTLVHHPLPEVREVGDEWRLLNP